MQWLPAEPPDEVGLSLLDACFRRVLRHPTSQSCRRERFRRCKRRPTYNCAVCTDRCIEGDVGVYGGNTCSTNPSSPSFAVALSPDGTLNPPANVPPTKIPSPLLFAMAAPI